MMLENSKEFEEIFNKYEKKQEQNQKEYLIIVAVIVIVFIVLPAFINFIVLS